MARRPSRITNIRSGGGGPGFLYPTIRDIALSAATIAEASVEDTPVGVLTAEPSDVRFILRDSAGNRFKLINGNEIVAGSVATDFAAATEHVITVRADWAGAFHDQEITITVTDVI